MSDTIRHPVRRASWCGAVAGLALAAGALPALAQSAAPAEEPAAAMEALHAELGALKDRVQTLERIATDSGSRLSREIDDLRH